MALEQAIFAALNGTTAAGARVYPVMAPQGAVLPYIVYSRVSNAPVVSLSGRSGLDEVRIQIDCWAPSYGAAQALGKAVRDLMEAQPFKALLQTDADSCEPDTKLYRWTLDFRCWDRL